MGRGMLISCRDMLTGSYKKGDIVETSCLRYMVEKQELTLKGKLVFGRLIAGNAGTDDKPKWLVYNAGEGREELEQLFLSGDWRMAGEQ